MGVKRDKDAIALFSFVLRNLDEERQIDDHEKTLTGINVCPHWIHDLSTISYLILSTKQ